MMFVGKQERLRKQQSVALRYKYDSGCSTLMSHLYVWNLQKKAGKAAAPATPAPAEKAGKADAKGGKKGEKKLRRNLSIFNNFLLSHP